MIKKFLSTILTVVLMSFTLQAQASVKCVGKISGVVAIEKQFDIPEGSRTKIFELDQSVVYLTHKKDFYSLEMFVPALEQRVYSEGTLTEKQPLTLALWTRDQLLEISCGTRYILQKHCVMP